MNYNYYFFLLTETGESQLLSLLWFVIPSPVSFTTESPSSYETCHIMRSRNLFLLVYLALSCFGKR